MVEVEDPFCISDLLWLLTRPASMHTCGIGLSLAEASRLSIAEIDNLLRAPDERGNPTNPNASRQRAERSMIEARETRLSMQAQIDAAEKAKRG